FRPMLLTIDASGGHPEPFPMHKAYRGAFSPDGQNLAYTPMQDAFRTWKRYRGGQTTPIRLVDLDDFSHVEIPHQNASDTSPVWMGDEIYFLSDRNGVMSLFRYRVPSREVEEVLRNGSTDIDSLAGSHGRLAYASGGYVFLYDIQQNEARRVSITVPEEGDELTARLRNVSHEVRLVALSPDGSEVVIEAHGEIATRSASGAFSNLTRSPGAADRGPAWSPDGRTIAFFSDASGEYRLHTADASGAAPSATVPLSQTGLGNQLRWSPDGTKLSFIDRFRRLWYVEVTTGEEKRIEGLVDPGDSYAWSPDGRFIAYSDLRPTMFRNLALHSLDSGTSVTLTDGIGDAHRPAFSRDSVSLFFLGSTSAGKEKTGLDLSVLAHRNDVSWSVYRVNLSDRSIERVPIPASRYVDLQVGDGGALFLGEDPGERTFAGKRRLSRFDPEKGELAAFLSDVDQFEVASNGSRI
ncbi:MAG: hypothetical protein ACRD21_25115, partial [Vicinamibacteria bacterium]